MNDIIDVCGIKFLTKEDMKKISDEIQFKLVESGLVTACFEISGEEGEYIDLKMII